MFSIVLWLLFYIIMLACVVSGDIAERPYVVADPDINIYPCTEDDHFIIGVQPDISLYKTFHSNNLTFLAGCLHDCCVNILLL